MKTCLIIAISIFAVSLQGRAAELTLEICASIEDPVKRFACYDTLAGRSPADTAKASGTEPSAVDPEVPKAEVIVPAAPTETPTSSAAVPTPDAEAIFGLEHKQKEEDLLDELRLKWTEKKKDAYGKWIITLENGQVWRQTDSRRFNFGNSEQWVVISRSVLGFFFMGEPERSGRIRVKRVK